jgi:hypothetical protein
VSRSPRRKPPITLSRSCPASVWPPRGIKRSCCGRSDDRPCVGSSHRYTAGGWGERLTTPDAPGEQAHRTRRKGAEQHPVQHHRARIDRNSARAQQVGCTHCRLSGIGYSLFDLSRLPADRLPYRYALPPHRRPPTGDGRRRPVAKDQCRSQMNRARAVQCHSVPPPVEVPHNRAWQPSRRAAANRRPSWVNASAHARLRVTGELHRSTVPGRPQASRPSPPNASVWPSAKATVRPLRGRGRTGTAVPLAYHSRTPPRSRCSAGRLRRTPGN